MEVMKKFISYYKPYKTMFFLDMFCALMISAVDLTLPQILSYLNTTFYIQPKDMITDSLLLLREGLLVVYIIRAICRYCVTAQGYIMGVRIESDMHQDLFNQFERLSFSYCDHNNTGEMMSKLVSDLLDISESAHHGPENVFVSLLKVIDSFLLLLYIHILLTLTLIAVTLVMLILSMLQNKRMQATFMDSRRKIADINASLQDSLTDIHVVKSFINGNIERGKFSHGNQLFLQSKTNNYYRMGLFHAGNNFFQGILYLTILVAGEYFIADGTLDPISLATHALYINIFVAPIEVLAEFTEMFQEGYSGFKRFLEVIETELDIQDAPDAQELKNVRGAIDYDHIIFSHSGGEHILDGVSIRIEADRSIALAEPSGGRKATICSLLPRFYDVKNGAVRVDGQDVQTLTLRSLHKAIGIVQQDVYLSTGSVKENIAYGKPGCMDEEIIGTAKKVNIHDFIMGLSDGYDTYVGERGTRLPGGQKQRINIARAFLKDPRISILDETTNALNGESERHIQKSLEELAKNRTYITITHRLSTMRNADGIIAISENGTEERGTHDELFTKGSTYAKYYHMQFGGLDFDEQTRETLHSR